jgi:hypothetical protein
VAQDPDARLRADVADILGLSRDASALSMLEKMVRDRDPAVVGAAQRALTRLRTALSSGASPRRAP